MNDSNAQAPFVAPEAEDLAALFPGYEIYNLIAAGGMGAVYAAMQKSLDRPVAIKILPIELSCDATFRKQFEDEAKAMARLNHPNLIGVYDFGEVAGMLFIVMEFVEGKSLYHSAYRMKIDPLEVIDLVTEICSGLAHAHKNGILHRDIKPANILLTMDKVPKIGDFGLARPMERSYETDEVIYGTPGYTAPEVFLTPGSIDHRADLYSLGVILYELLTGSLPERGSYAASRLSNCDVRFNEIIKRSVDADPSKRYESVSEMATALQGIKSVSPQLVSKPNPAFVSTHSAAPRRRAVTPVIAPKPSRSSRPGLVPRLFLVAASLIGIGFAWNLLKPKPREIVSVGNRQEVRTAEVPPPTIKPLEPATSRTIPPGTKFTENPDGTVKQDLGPNSDQSLSTENEQQAAIRKKLETIIIPSVDFTNAKLEESIDFLRLRSSELDTSSGTPTAKGVNFVLSNNSPEDYPLLSLRLRNVSLAVTLKHIAELSGLKIQIRDYFVELNPASIVVAPEIKASASAVAANASKIIVPVIYFRDTTLSEAVQFYNLWTRDFVRSGNPPTIILDATAEKQARIRGFRVLNISLLAAISHNASATNHQVTFEANTIRIGKAVSSPVSPYTTITKSPKSTVGTPEPMNVQTYLELRDRKGSKLTLEEVALLEKEISENPNDTNKRVQLIGYYLKNRSAETKSVLGSHYLWFIENSPDSKFFDYGIHYEFRDGDAYERAKAIWLSQIETHPGNPDVLTNAAGFFRQTDSTFAEKCLLRAAELERDSPSRWDDLGLLYMYGGNDHKVKSVGKALAAYEKAEDAEKARKPVGWRNGVMARLAYQLGDIDKASNFVHQSFQFSGAQPDHYYSIEILHYGHTILGLICLRNGDVNRAKEHLLESAKISPAPSNLANNGPTMSLAKELYEKGQRTAVLEYFTMCGKFWKSGGWLEKATQQVEAGVTPEFKNLLADPSRPVLIASTNGPRPEGGKEDEAPKSAPVSPEPVLGTWAWNGGSKQFTLHANGSATEPNNRKGHWVSKDSQGILRQYVITWETDKYVDTIELAADGARLDIRNQFGGVLFATRVGPAILPVPPAAAWSPDPKIADIVGTWKYSDTTAIELKPNGAVFSSSVSIGKWTQRDKKGEYEVTTNRKNYIASMDKYKRNLSMWSRSGGSPMTLPRIDDGPTKNPGVPDQVSAWRMEWQDLEAEIKTIEAKLPGARQGVALLWDKHNNARALGRISSWNIEAERAERVIQGYERQIKTYLARIGELKSKLGAP